MLTPDRVQGRRIIDVGACDFNGSIRPLLESYGPSEYIGIDVLEGPSVDRVMDANDLVEVFGEASFDIVIAMEMLEHSPDWRRSINAMKRVCKPGGILVVTAPSRGHPYHGYPDDYWRYELEDFKAIFADCQILALEHDPSGPGTNLCVRKPQNFDPCDLDAIKLHSMVTGGRTEALLPAHWKTKHFKKVRLQQFLANNGRAFFQKCGRSVRSFFRV